MTLRLLPAVCLLHSVVGSWGEENSLVEPAGEAGGCYINRSKTNAEICSYVENVVNGCAGEGWFPFLEAYFCWVNEPGRVPMFAVYVFWCCLLLYVLGTTADEYFAPATIQLSDWLGLRPRVAGVTLLALGNGAPDVFSVLAAYRSGQGELAVGALVGGSMFVTTVVVGAVITASGGECKARGMFLRDVGWNILGQVALFFMCLSGTATLWEAALLLGLYTAYVLSVTFGHKVPPLLKRDREAWFLAKEVLARSSARSAEAGLGFRDLRSRRRSSIQAENLKIEGAIPSHLLAPPATDTDAHGKGLPPPPLSALSEAVAADSAASVRGAEIKQALLGDSAGGRGGVGMAASEREVQERLLLEGSKGARQRSCWLGFEQRCRNATRWADMSPLERASYCVEAIMHFFRGLTIPPIPEDDELQGELWDNAFQRTYLNTPCIKSLFPEDFCN